MKKSNQDIHNNQSNRISELEESNKNLQDKLKLLKIQLMSQSQLQLASFSQPRSASLSRSRTNLNSSRHFHSTTGLRAEDHAKPSPRKPHEAILHQLTILQEELVNVKEQHKNRIAELEKQVAKSQKSTSPTLLKLELNENVELIKLKRLSKKQSAQILSLQSQLELSNAELKQLQANLQSLTNEKDHLQTELSSEKCENTKLLSNISTLKQNTKILDEQIDDLQKEKNTLKEHNENLLQLSLKQKSTSSDAHKTNFSKQIKELQESLQREILAKSELSSKLSEAELSIVRHKNELAKNNSKLAELQATNQSIKNEIEKIKSTPKSDDVYSKSRTASISTEDKSVMAVPKNENEELSSIDNKLFSSATFEESDSSMKLQLYSVTQELNQYKELLRVQYGLNNKYKKELEELQKIFQKNEKLSSENLRSFQNILREHEEHLSKIKTSNSDESLKTISAALSKIFTVKKLGSYHDYINCIQKILSGYVSFVEHSLSANSVQCDENITAVDNLIINNDHIVHVESKKEIAELSDDDKSVIAPLAVAKVEDMFDKSTSIVFELQIKRANFDYFSSHLMKSSGNKPRIFLTWNFLDDNEHQAYTPTISVDEGNFDCLCQYEGPWSEFLHQYLRERGIRVEIHLVQDDISVRLAETKINTSSVLNCPDQFRDFTSQFENDNIKGNVTGTFILRSSLKM